jgi:integrase
MPDRRFRRTTPKYRLHKATGQARVTLDGKTFYLGVFGTPESHEKYDRLIAEWLEGGRQASGSKTEEGYKVNDLLLAFDKAHEGYYHEGEQTSELKTIQDAVGPLRQLYGRTVAKDFGPKQLKAIRTQLVEKGLTRGYINRQVARIRRVFRWGAEEELVPASVFHALQAVRGLRRGMTAVLEAEPVLPVPVDDVWKTLPFLPPVVRVMVEVQHLLGCRPGEVCRLRTADLERGHRDPKSGQEVWLYRLRKHKMFHHDGQERVIVVGPKAQELLKRWLRPDEPDAYIFSPAESERLRAVVRREQRKTPLRPSDSHEPNVREDRSERYKTHAYGVAIRRACKRAKVPVWTPNQLRHTRLTELRRIAGLECAKAIGGHKKIETTQIYAERDLAGALSIMAELG